MKVTVNNFKNEKSQEEIFVMCDFCGKPVAIEEIILNGPPCTPKKLCYSCLDVSIKVRNDHENEQKNAKPFPKLMQDIHTKEIVFAVYIDKDWSSEDPKFIRITRFEEVEGKPLQDLELLDNYQDFNGSVFLENESGN